MKLDKSRPHGLVFGHDSASYEQDGILFDGGGNQLGEYTPPEIIPSKAKPQSADKKLENAKDFLKGLLAGGPMDKSIVFKETESNNQSWATVRNAFAALDGKTIKMGSATLWSLVPDKINK